MANGKFELAEGANWSSSSTCSASVSGLWTISILSLRTPVKNQEKYHFWKKRDGQICDFDPLHCENVANTSKRSIYFMENLCERRVASQWRSGAAASCRWAALTGRLNLLNGSSVRLRESRYSENKSWYIEACFPLTSEGPHAWKERWQTPRAQREINIWNPELWSWDALSVSRAEKADILMMMNQTFQQQQQKKN